MGCKSKHSWRHFELLHASTFEIWYRSPSILYLLWPSIFPEIPNLKPSVEYLKRSFLNHVVFFLLFFLEQITDRQIDLFYNLGQDVADKFTKLSKIGFSIDCFTADCLRLFTVKRQNLAFGWTTGYSPSNPSISGIFLKFPNFLRS